MPTNMFRHGDLLLRGISAVPKEATLLPTNTLAEGEVTGHNHSFTSGSVQVFAPSVKTENVAKYVQVISKEASLTHQEHKKIVIPQGVYKLTIEREYSPLDKVVRQVVD